ncbi:hypothetical protein JTB14_011728 [Gonioctena quinquepunctata]|nr:hypothetical protein JTB14_011728 [Gonioctena quinquepunctata]
MSSKGLPNDEEFKISFVQTVELYTCLYDYTLKVYSNRNEQDEAWNKVAGKYFSTVATEFNAACPYGNLREATVLKKFYENKKKEVRKVVADEKTEINGTGGGPATIIKKDNTFDLILSILNHKTVFGLENKYSNLTDPLLSSSRVNMEEFTYVFSDNSPTIEVEVLNEIDENLSVNQSEVLDTNQLLNKTEKSENWRHHRDGPGIVYSNSITGQWRNNISVMFCGNANGDSVAPFIIYKAEHLWTTWLEGGPEGEHYNRTKQGWIDGATFEDWFLAHLSRV